MGGAVQNHGSVGGALGTGAGRAWRLLRSGASVLPHAHSTGRWMHGFAAAASSFGSHFLRVLRALFLQVMGSLFLAIAAIASYPAVKEYHRWQAGAQGPQKFFVTAAFILLFAYYGVSSFWRTRKL